MEGGGREMEGGSLGEGGGVCLYLRRGGERRKGMQGTAMNTFIA